MNAPDMDTERLLYDDGHSGCRRRTDRKTQRGRRVSGLAPAYLDAQSLIGKEVVEAVRIDAGQTRPPRSRMLKSRGCDAMTSAGGSFSGRSSESRDRNGLGKSDPDRCTPLSKKGSNDE